MSIYLNGRQFPAINVEREKLWTVRKGDGLSFAIKIPMTLYWTFF